MGSPSQLWLPITISLNTPSNDVLSVPTLTLKSPGWQIDPSGLFHLVHQASLHAWIGMSLVH